MNADRVSGSKVMVCKVGVMGFAGGGERERKAQQPMDGSDEEGVGLGTGNLHTCYRSCTVAFSFILITII